MKYTNYNFTTDDERNAPAIILKDMLEALQKNEFCGVKLQKDDENEHLIRCIIADIQALEIKPAKEGTYTGYVFGENFERPDCITTVYMNMLYRCDADSPLSDEYLTALTNQISNGSKKPVEQVVQFAPEGMSYTILPDGSLKEAQVDQEINHWYNLYNINKTDDQNAYDNLIIKLRSLIPYLKKKEKQSGGKHTRYQIVSYTSPTDFVLADFQQAANKIQISNGNIAE